VSSVLCCPIICLYGLCSVLCCPINCLYGLSSVLCCPIICLYELCSVLWYPLWFSHRNDVFTSRSCFIYIICVCVQHIVCFGFFYSSCVPYNASFSGLSILYCPLSNVYLSCVLCTLWCQFLWIVYPFSNVYLSCVLCTLWCQFLWIVCPISNVYLSCVLCTL
jgi:hypothetical protein